MYTAESEFYTARDDLVTKKEALDNNQDVKKIKTLLQEISAA